MLPKCLPGLEVCSDVAGLRVAGLSVPQQSAGQCEEAYLSVHFPYVRVCTRYADIKEVVCTTIHTSVPFSNPAFLLRLPRG